MHLPSVEPSEHGGEDDRLGRFAPDYFLNTPEVPVPAGDTTSALDFVTLVVAIFGVALAAVSLSWQATTLHPLREPRSRHDPPQRIEA